MIVRSPRTARNRLEDDLKIRLEIFSLGAVIAAAGLSAVGYVFSLGQFAEIGPGFQSFYSLYDLVSNTGKVIPHLFSSIIVISLVILFLIGIAVPRSKIRDITQIRSIVLFTLIGWTFLFFVLDNNPTQDVKDLFLLVSVACTVLWVRDRKLRARSIYKVVIVLVGVFSAFYSIYFAGRSDIEYRQRLICKNELMLTETNSRGTRVMASIAILFTGGSGSIIVDSSTPNYLTSHLLPGDLKNLHRVKQVGELCSKQNTDKLIRAKKIPGLLLGIFVPWLSRDLTVN